MKKSIIIFLSILFIFECKLYSQELKSDSLLRNNFDEILPDGEFRKLKPIKTEDINGDGKLDVIYRWKNYIIRDGDNLKYSIFITINDTLAVLKKTLHNLSPLYFKQDEEKARIGDKWGPVRDVRFENKKIIIEHWDEPYSFIRETFLYNDSLDNWFLMKKVIFEVNSDGENSILYEFKIKLLESTIDEFRF